MTLAYRNITNTLGSTGAYSFTQEFPLLITSTTPYSINIVWLDLNSKYRVDFGGQIVDSETTSVDIYNVTPSQSYAIKLFTTNDNYSTFSEEASENFTMPSDISSSYSGRGGFLKNSNEYDLSVFTKGNQRNMLRHFSSGISNGSRITMDIGGKNRTLTYISSSITPETDAASLPFYENEASGTITVGDTDIGYDETTDSLVVDGTSLSEGDSFIVDGKKATIVSL